VSGIAQQSSFFDGVSKLQGWLLIGKRFSLKFLKCDQLTKVREQQYLYRAYAEKVHEKKISRLAKQVL
jgi:hypothetical protein